MPMFTIRATNEEYAYVKAIADALGESVSSVARDSVFELIDEWRARAKAAQEKIKNLPHGVTESMTEEAAARLIDDINQRAVLSLPTGDLFGARSKALYRLLATVWAEKPDAAAKKFLAGIEKRVGAARAQLDEARPAHPAPAPNLDALDAPATRRTKSYPPRAGKRRK